MQFKQELRNYLLIIIIGAILFFPMLGNVNLFDWDEINFAEAAREMIATGDYLTVRIDYAPFHEKPPLFFWMQVAAMKIFGINEFASRLPNALIGILSLLLIYSIGRKLFDYRFGFIWVLAYTGSVLPFFYFKSGIIDPLFNLFIFASIYYLSEYYFLYLNSTAQKLIALNKDIIFAGLLISLAVMTKGPVAYLITALVFIVFWFFSRKQARFPFISFMLFSVIVILIPVLWYLLISYKFGGNLVNDFLLYQLRLFTTQDAGHGGPFYYHFVILLFGCFPASAFVFRAFRKNTANTLKQEHFRKWAIILLCVVLVLFSIVSTKIVHYSSIAYFPLTFLAAYVIYSLVFRDMRWKATTSWLLGIIGITLAVLLAALPLLLMNINIFLPKVSDKFTLALLKSDVVWGGSEYLTGVFYFISVIIVLFLFYKRSVLAGSITLFSATALALFVFLPSVAPKIEQYTQGVPIEFYKSLQGKDCYVQVLGYKSYAHYFYGQKSLQNSAFYKKMKPDKFEEWLINGDIDKTAYFVCKNTSAEQYLIHKQLQTLYTKNGFVFMKREVNKLH
ncbi:MAG: glycosyltransferase family 39 protein [Bacteroidota bacterium]